MKVAFVHPCVGRRRGEPYVRGWQMEPLAPALLAARTPRGVEVRLHDDRMEAIPYDAPVDLVAISVETYTARRAYQIASAYRARGVPVVMGGFHATLVPDEVAEWADAVVVGEAEAVWPELVDDARHGRLRPLYRGEANAPLRGATPDRRLFEGRRYLPVSLVESARGCPFGCEFCSVQTVFARGHRRRPVDEVVAEVASLTRKDGRLVFFVDDNLTAGHAGARELLEALAPLGARWVSQASIDVARDEELLALLARSGCQGLLVGLESTSPESLERMNKGWNVAEGGYDAALAAFRRHGIRLYVTFVAGYDGDTPESVAEAVDLAERHRVFMAAFNHLTPFPGTPLYARLEREGRLLHERWWLDPAYSYGDVPFRPARMTAAEVREVCVAARRRFYRLASIARRGLDLQQHARDARMWAGFFGINLLVRREVETRRGFPLGDEAFEGPLRPVRPERGPGAA